MTKTAFHPKHIVHRILSFAISTPSPKGVSIGGNLLEAFYLKQLGEKRIREFGKMIILGTSGTFGFACLCGNAKPFITAPPLGPRHAVSLRWLNCRGDFSPTLLRCWHELLSSTHAVWIWLHYYRMQPVCVYILLTHANYIVWFCTTYANFISYLIYYSAWQA